MTATAILAPVQTKTCTKCGQSLSTSCFHKDENGIFKVRSICKICCIAVKNAKREKIEQLKLIDPVAYENEIRKRKEKEKERYAKTRDYHLNKKRNLGSEARKKNAERQKARYLKNPNKFKEVSKTWRENNKEKVRDDFNKWRKSNIEHLNEYARNRYHNVLKQDEMFKVKSGARFLVSRSILLGGYQKKSRTREILGCDWEFFKSHIERQFLKGMTWENRSKWHIDHIVPMATAKTEEEVIALNHFTNLRPLWAKDNLAKHAKVTHLI